MKRKAPFPRSILGGGFEGGFVAGSVADASRMPRILEALKSLALDRDRVRAFPGIRALELDASDHPSLALGSPLPGEVVASGFLVAGALLNDVIIAVEAPSEERAVLVSQLLFAEGVYGIQYYTATSVRPVGVNVPVATA